MKPLATFLDRWSEISPLLDEALSRPRDEQAAWLDRLDGERAIHRDSLRALLAHRAAVETDDFLSGLPALDVGAVDVDGADRPADVLAPGDPVGAIACWPRSDAAAWAPCGSRSGPTGR